jgi:UDP-N-acetylglucosamine--N-acetylmuramyl-(pentapeptide) pyrophosphoryl-undecaprenol N-acetylglucosamine transferase
MTTVKSPPLVVLAAGGTGGHVFPAEALAAELKTRGANVVLFTDRRGDAVGGAPGGVLGGVETRRIRSAGVAGKGLAARIRSTLELGLGLFQARSLLRRLTPQAVVGFGGYPSVPTMLAACFGGYHTLVHEQNAVLGRANRLLAGRVERIASAFEHPARLPAGAAGKIVHTGMPVRSAFAEIRGRSYPDIGTDGPIRLLVLGGSQGARVFGEVVPDAIGRLDERLRRRLLIGQQCRPENLEQAEAAYRRLGLDAELARFFNDVPQRLAAAHLVIARAGASTVAEITAVGRPAILIPYPHAIDDHQSANARAVADAGAAWVMAQPTFTPEALAERLRGLLAAPDTLRQAAERARTAGRPEAAARLADAVFDLIGSNGADGGAKKERRAA